MSTSTAETADAAPRAHRPVVLALPPLAAAVVLALLTWQVTAGGPLTRIDVAVRDGLGAYTDVHRDVWWFAQLAADIGTPWLAAVLLAVVAVVLALERHSASPIYRAAFALFLLGVTVLFMKGLIHRPGPAGGAPTGPNGFFPSGHTASALTCYGTIALLLAAGRARAVRVLLLSTLAVLGVLTSTGLLVCAYHWLTDVLASAVLSFAVLWLTFPPGHGASLLPGGRGPDQSMDT